MGKTIVHEGAVVKCLHGGDARPQMVSARVKVSGKRIALQNSSYRISGCSLSYDSGGPCTLAPAWQNAATRVRSEGVAVLLQDSKTSCIRPGSGLNILRTQTRVKGV